MVPFGDLSREYNEMREELDNAIKDVCEKGWFVLGKKLEIFEDAFAGYIGKGVYAVGTGSGTEAIHLALVAAGVGYGDYVVTVPNTAVPTVSAISFAGAVPLFVDIDPQSFNMDPVSLRDVLAKEKKRLGKRLKAVVPVHLYGQSADMDPVMEAAREYGLKVIEDACQAHGAEYKGKKAGSIGDYAAFSFYPSKNLGAYGDGGVVLTSDPEEARKLKMLRNYGQEKRYYHSIKGFNSRLDEIQASVLLAKLKYLDGWNARRREIAAYYTLNIKNGCVRTPAELPWAGHVFHLYVVRTPERDRFREHLEQNGVQTVIHYPVPVHLQEAYRELGYPAGGFPEAEKAASEIVSLPIFPQLRKEEADKVIDAVNDYEPALKPERLTV